MSVWIYIRYSQYDCNGIQINTEGLQKINRNDTVLKSIADRKLEKLNKHENLVFCFGEFRSNS